jgi:hypothetical protein
MPAIPLRIYITPFADKGVVEAARWSRDAATKALNVVNDIWSKANISFVTTDCVIDKPLDMARSARNDDQRLLGVLSYRHQPDKTVHVYLVNPIENLIDGGGSYLDSDPEAAIFVQLYSSVDSCGRAWAHELGHLMSLKHVDIDYAGAPQAALYNNLMKAGLSMGRELTDKQIDGAKRSNLLKQFSA